MGIKERIVPISIFAAFGFVTTLLASLLLGFIISEVNIEELDKVVLQARKAKYAEELSAQTAQTEEIREKK